MYQRHFDAGKDRRSFHFFPKISFQVPVGSSSHAVHHTMQFAQSATMAFSMLAARRGVTAFTNPAAITRAASTFRPSPLMFAEDGQAEVVLVGCGAPNRGMGW
jgi:hypothetical protein